MANVAASSALKTNPRRVSPRRTTLQSATVYVDGSALMKCLVRNLSDGGAQLVVSAPGAVPDTFDLAIGQAPARPCRLVWRKQTVLGVAFEPATTQPVTTQPANSGGDRRVAVRRRTLRSGTIAFNGDHSTIKCMIVDLSDTGARLRPLSPEACPAEFDLIVGDGTRFKCLVVRRGSEELGVRFLCLVGRGS